MSKGNRTRAAFSIIEALVAVVLLGIGIASALRGMSSLSAAEFKARESEAAHRLAVAKYDELIATGQITTSTTSLSGDFTDQSEDRFTWQADVTNSNVDNLQTLTVTVKRTNSDNNWKTTVSGLLYQPPPATAGAAGGG